MRIVFFGIYDLGLRALTRLVEADHTIPMVVTKPITPGDVQPVAEFARGGRIPLFQPTGRELPAVAVAINAVAPELIVVAGYHRRIPENILAIPTCGSLNVHGSLLPAYRGPCPWKHQIARGETTGGVTIHRMTAEFDRGPILSQRSVPIADYDTGGTLFAKLTFVAAELLVETVAGIANGNLNPTSPDESLASYFGYPSDADTRIRWDTPAMQIRNLVRGMFPRPKAWTQLDSVAVRVGQAVVVPNSPTSECQPGIILGASKYALTVATATHAIRISDLEYDGAIAARVGARLE